MFPRIILCEDEEELSTAYIERLQLHGFQDIHAFADTRDMLSRVRELYTKPTILLTDWYIAPSPPTSYVPELRRAGIPIPVVVVSSRGRFELLSDLNASCGLAAWFAKGADPDVLISKVANCLMDLSNRADAAWDEHCAVLEAKQLARSYRPEQCEAMHRLLGFALPKELISDDQGGFTKDMVYKVRTDMIGFMRKNRNPSVRYNALLRVFDEASAKI